MTYNDHIELLKDAQELLYNIDNTYSRFQVEPVIHSARATEANNFNDLTHRMNRKTAG